MANNTKLVKFPEDGELFKKVKKTAIDRGIDANALIIKMIEEYYAKRDAVKMKYVEAEEVSSETVSTKSSNSF